MATLQTFAVASDSATAAILTSTINVASYSGTGRMVVIVGCASNTDVTADVTWNGVSLTDSGLHLKNGPFIGELHTLDNPDTGSHDLVVTWTASNTARVIMAWVVDDVNTGAAAVTPVQAGASSNTAQVSLVTANANSYIFAGVICDQRWDAATPGTHPEVQDYVGETGPTSNSDHAFLGGHTVDSGAVGAKTVSWSRAGIVRQWGIYAIEVPISMGTAVGQISETDSLISIGIVQPIIVPIGTIAEVDVLGGVSALVPIVAVVGVLAETDALVLVGGRKTASVGTLAEVDSLISVQVDKPILVGVGTMVESETLVSILVIKPIVVPVGVVSETELLVYVSADKPIVVSVETISESETLIFVSVFKPVVVAVGTISESDSLVGVDKPTFVLVGVLAETDALVLVGGRKAVSTGVLTEVDSLISVQAGKSVLVGVLTETNGLFGVGVVSYRMVNPQQSNLKRTNVDSSAKLTVVQSELKPTTVSTKARPTLVSSVVEGD